MRISLDVSGSFSPNWIHTCLVFYLPYFSQAGPCCSTVTACSSLARYTSPPCPMLGLSHPRPLHEYPLACFEPKIPLQIHARSVEGWSEDRDKV